MCKDSGGAVGYPHVGRGFTIEMPRGKWQLAKQLIRDIESYNASVAKSNAALSIASSIRQSHPLTDKEQT